MTHSDYSNCLVWNGFHVSYEAIYTCYFPGQCDLVEIKQYLKDMGRTAVTNLGLVLGILYPTMRALPDNDFLNEAITLWLDKADDVTIRGEPSWRTLVKGLRDDQIRQTGVANNIAKEHCTTDGQSQSTLPCTVVNV